MGSANSSSNVSRKIVNKCILLCPRAVTGTLWSSTHTYCVCRSVNNILHIIFYMTTHLKSAIVQCGVIYRYLNLSTLVCFATDSSIIIIMSNGTHTLWPCMCMQAPPLPLYSPD